MSVDGPVRVDVTTPPRGGETNQAQTGYLAGSKALDSLDRLITSTESFFHPSNSGQWTLNVNIFDYLMLRKCELMYTRKAYQFLETSCCAIRSALEGRRALNLSDTRGKLINLLSFFHC